MGFRYVRKNRFFSTFLRISKIFRKNRFINIFSKMLTWNLNVHMWVTIQVLEHFFDIVLPCTLKINVQKNVQNFENIDLSALFGKC